MDVLLSPFISVLSHSDWLFHGESCPRIDVVHPGHAWSSSPACTWHCCLHYLFLLATALFPHGVTVVGNVLALTVSNSSLFTPALLRTYSFVFFAIHITHRNFFFSHFITKASRCVSSFFLSVQLLQPYVATGHISAFISRIFVELEISKLWLFHIFCSDPRLPAPCLTWFCHTLTIFC